jgi:hypothetical protein
VRKHQTGRRNLLLISVKDTAANRIAAIEILTEIADADNTATIRKDLNSMRFDGDQTVRAAVERALDKLKDK